tara:strand:+ start:245 stop:601 length:357 start_codon:yes stop_codon:yes gene_type:complete
MNKILILILSILLFPTYSFAGPAEELYYKNYAKRMVADSRFCEKEAEASGTFDANIFDRCNAERAKLEKLRHEMAIAKDKAECESIRRRIQNSGNVGSDAGNFLQGVLNGKMESMACY